MCHVQACGAEPCRQELAFTRAIHNLKDCTLSLYASLQLLARAFELECTWLLQRISDVDVTLASSSFEPASSAACEEGVDGVL